MLTVFPPPGSPGGADEAPRMGTAMHQIDINRAIARHKQCPHAYTAYAVACNVLWYRKQVGLDLRPKELAEMLGIHYDHARAVLRRVKADEDQTKPEDSAPVHNAPEDSAPEDSAPVNRRVVLRSQPSPLSTPCIEGLKERETDSHARETTTDDINAAVRILSDHINTGHVASHLLTVANAEDVQAVASDGWRFESAARKFVSSETDPAIHSRPKKQAFAYLLAVARNLSEPWHPRPCAPLRATGTAGRPNPVRSLAEDLEGL